MKRALTGIAVGSLMLAILLTASAAKMEHKHKKSMMHKDKDMKTCPVCKMCMADDEDKQECKKMMKEADIDDDTMKLHKALVGAELYGDSPAVLLGMGDKLNLTEDQKSRLKDIQNTARTDAQAVLNADQKNMLVKTDSATSPKKTMMKIHKKMMGWMKEKGMECPMAGKETGEGKVCNTNCPIMGTKLDRDNVPDNLTRMYKGKKVGFCCPGCPAKWDELSDAEKKEKLDKVMAEDKG